MIYFICDQNGYDQGSYMEREPTPFNPETEDERSRYLFFDDSLGQKFLKSIRYFYNKRMFDMLNKGP